MSLENQEPTEERSQSDRRPEVDASVHRPAQLVDSDSEETSHTVFFHVSTICKAKMFASLLLLWLWITCFMFRIG